MFDDGRSRRADTCVRSMILKRTLSTAAHANRMTRNLISSVPPLLHPPLLLLLSFPPPFLPSSPLSYTRSLVSTPADTAVAAEIAREVARRRTFAIISHPDAGKTTLTEKTLLYAGAIELAGAVRGRKSQRAVVSDWMEIERDRGISITSAALEFDLWDQRVVLLDTPGHKDFSEDTYRTLLAVDSVVMVLDAAKGIETQTRKLFEVCRQQSLPILTF